MNFYFITRENLLLSEHMIIAKFKMPENVDCDGFAAKGVSLISVGKIVNPYYVYLFPAQTGRAAAAALVCYKRGACSSSCLLGFAGQR